MAQLSDIITDHHVVLRERNNDHFRPPDKSAHRKTISFISHPKHMLWVHMYIVIGTEIDEKIRVRIVKLFPLFLIQNICCGYICTSSSEQK